MYNVVILSETSHVAKSLTTLINLVENLKVVAVTSDLEEIQDGHFSLDKGILIIDMKLPNFKRLLDMYAQTHKVLLYSHSKEFSEISEMLNQYNVDFFNVYTSPNCIIDLIRKTVSRTIE